MNPSTPCFSRSGFPERIHFPPLSLSLVSILFLLIVGVSGCHSKVSRYALVEDSLRAGNTQRADQILERAEREYGSESRVLYQMDRGMTLHLAGRHQESSTVLEQAEEEVERLYTRHLHTEAKAFLINDSKQTYQGDAYEQTMINVLKSLNYAVMGNWTEAVVEARRIDHRLNVLADRVSVKDGYRDDAFARYLSGILYEVDGDLNNAFIAYRKAYDEYRRAREWSRTPIPPALRTDLLRMTEALHLVEEHEEYRRDFADVSWRPYSDTQSLGQIIVIGYNGRAPRKEDRFIDLPVSLDALNLVLLTKATGSSNYPERRAAESLLYGLNGRVVRVSIPMLIPQKSQVQYADVTATSPGGAFSTRTDLVHNLSAVADKTLSDHLMGISIKAVARAVVKFALAEGVGHGARAAVGKNAGPLVGILVGSLAKALAVASEEADKRSWRTLPDEIQIARLWVPPGTYEIRYRPVTRSGGALERESIRSVTVGGGETSLLTERVVP